MPLFFIIAALLVVTALVAIVPSVLKISTRTELDQLETNIRIAKDRRTSLQRALADGSIDQTTYDSDLRDVENALALDLSAEKKERDSSRGGYVIAACIAVFIPIASGVLYLQLGTPQGVDSQAMHEQSVAAQTQATSQSPDLTELLPNLEKKLEANPNDRDGWKLLGKSYLIISEFANAKRALLKAYELDSEDSDLLTQLAEATAMERGGDLSGEATDYLDRALAITPNHEASMWLRAIASQQAGQHEDAIARLQTLRTGVSGNAGAIASIDELLSKSKQALGLANETNDSTVTATAASPAPNNENSTVESAPAASASLNVTVTLSDEVKANVNASDSVFIFARASTGPPMPLAVSRHSVSDLPITVTLDDTMAMMPAMTLSQFPSVTVGARISPSGNAIAQPGDWYAEQNNVLPADVAELTLMINKQN